MFVVVRFISVGNNYFDAQGLFMYWCTNNTISIIQTLILKQEPVRNFFNIPKPPKEEDTPALKIVNPFNKVMDAINREKSKGEAAEAEILGKGAASVPKAPPGPPVTTFSHNPKRVKKETPQ